MSNTTTVEQAVTELGEQVAALTGMMQTVLEQQTVIQAELQLLPIATGKAFWEKRDGIIRLMGMLHDIPQERVEKIVNTKCVYSWEEGIPNW